VHYRPNDLLSGIDRLERDELLTATEAAELRSAVVPAEELTYEKHCEMKHAMKKHYILRWTINEIMQGRKVLPKGKAILLTEALSHQTITKCDVWAFVDGRYIEVTNYFFLMWTDKEGGCDAGHRDSQDGSSQPHLHIISPPFPSYEEAVNLDISHYLGVRAVLSGESGRIIRLCGRVYVHTSTGTLLSMHALTGIHMRVRTRTPTHCA
jgi:hypothetical protein